MTAWPIALLSITIGGGPVAQTPTPDEFRVEAIGALGRDVTGIEVVASGWDACLGQAWSVTDGWARWELTDYHRSIDYAGGASMHTAMRRPELDPGRTGGCGAQPQGPAVQQQSYVDTDAPWPQQLPIWATPHGFLRLLDSGNGVVQQAGEGWRVTVPVVRDSVTYRLVADYDGNFELRRIETWVDNSIFGDMSIAAEFGPYRAFGELAFPESLTVEEGGFATLHLEFDDVQPDVQVERRAARAGGPGGAATDRPPFTQIGDGIFLLDGAYQAVAVEFDDYSVVIDGMQNDGRTRDVIAVTKQAIPDKPIRYVVNTHSHFDHASGLRQYVAEGATILTHERNVEFFRNALGQPRTLNPNAVQTAGMPIRIEGVGERYRMTDSSGQSLELYHLRGYLHADDMLIAYLPSIGTVVESDVLQPWINPRFGGDGHPFLVHLARELDRLALDVQQFVPVHRIGQDNIIDAAALRDAVD